MCISGGKIIIFERKSRQFKHNALWKKKEEKRVLSDFFSSAKTLPYQVQSSTR
jgi:hypothetical protein